MPRKTISSEYIIIMMILSCLGMGPSSHGKVKKDLEESVGDFLGKLPIKAHPYFGYVYDEKLAENVNSHGFLSDIEFTKFKRDKNTLVVGIFGGSEAAVFIKELQSQNLIESFLRSFQLNDISIKFLNFTIEGHNQLQTFYIRTFYKDLVDIGINITSLSEQLSAQSEAYPGFFPRYSNILYNNDINQLVRILKYLRGTQKFNGESARKKAVNVYPAHVQDSYVNKNHEAFVRKWKKIIINQNAMIKDSAKREYLILVENNSEILHANEILNELRSEKVNVFKFDMQSIGCKSFKNCKNMEKFFIKMTRQDVD